MYHVTRLSNGLTIASAEMPHMASVAVGLWVGVGGRFEPQPISGVAHFIEHLLFKGTGRRTAKEISEAVEGVGGYLNAFTTEENTCFHARAHADRTEHLLDVLVDMFTNSRFAPGDIAKERDVIKEEIAMYRDQPQQYVHDLLHEILWPDHALGRALTGTEKTLDAIRRPEMLAFLRANYGAENTVIAIAGPLQHADVLRRCRKFAGKFCDGGKPTFAPAETEQRAPVVRLHTSKTEQTQLAVGVRACSRHDELRFAVRVLNAIIGESMSSRLFQILREDKGIAYSVYSSWAFLEDTGAISISAGLDDEDLEKTLRIIARELRALGETLVSPAELRRARDFVIGQMELSLEGTENQMNWIGESLLGFDRILEPRDVKQRLASVTASEVRAAARAFLRPERLNAAIVSPLENSTGLDKLLRW